MWWKNYVPYVRLNGSKTLHAMKKFFVAAAVLFSASVAFPITREEALDFLYSSMSLPDRADYTEDFYAANVDASLKAREEMPWGSIVPDREFLHFVLPVRVNNENLDNARMVFYEELKDRVRNLSMKDAILEVNHWCHEKVTYKPSDGRTSSPLSSVSQAIGRCGEESTFAVAALRSVGIPARQIYTPRWAHTDDNHAWVEAWADGKWHFIGACEPEPILDLAWFNDPASRGMLMNTNVTGDYRGPEEVLLKQPLSTRINVTSNYAPVATLPVTVVDKEGEPVAGAKVNFCIYNYAEYYPAVTKIADGNGNASLTAGLGDVVVWATDGRNFGFVKGNPKEFEENGGHMEVVLDKDSSFAGVFELNIDPPTSGAKLPSVSPGQRAENDRLMQREDSIRNAYVATFASPESSRIIAGRLGVNPEQLVKILSESRGNHNLIVNCLDRLPADKRDAAINLLLSVSEKDRRDIPVEVIEDNVLNVGGSNGINPETYNQYVLNPRVEVEYLRPWRKTLTEFFAPDATEFANNPEKLVAWVKDNIASADSENPMKLRMSPLAVLNTRKADRVSRNIFFVAAARSVGVPARIDPVTAATQYSSDGMTWVDVDFGDSDEPENLSGKGRLMVTYSPEGYMVDPKYYSQFSISKIEDGQPRLLEFEEEGTLSKLFATPYELEAGQYVLTTGQRLANGGVLARSEVFAVNPGETVTIPLHIRHDDSELSVIGSLNAENIYHDIASDSDKSLLSTTGRGFYVLGLIAPNHEPSAHALNDISAVANQLGDTGRKIIVLFDSESDAERFDRSHFPNLPDNVVFGVDNEGISRSEIVESLHLDNPLRPIFVVADTFNRIVWISTGYTIGLGDTLLSTLSRLK